MEMQTALMIFLFPCPTHLFGGSRTSSMSNQNVLLKLNIDQYIFVKKKVNVMNKSISTPNQELQATGVDFDLNNY